MGALGYFSHNQNIRLWLFICKDFLTILIYFAIFTMTAPKFHDLYILNSRYTNYNCNKHQLTSERILPLNLHNLKNFVIVMVVSLAGSCFLCLISTYNSFFTENTINKCLQNHTNFQNVSSYFNSAIDDSLSGMKVSYNDRQDLYFTDSDTHKLLKYTSHSLFTSDQGNFFDPSIFSMTAIKNYKKSKLFSRQDPVEREIFYQNYETNLYYVFVKKSNKVEKNKLYEHYRHYKKFWLVATLGTLMFFCTFGIWLLSLNTPWMFFKCLNISITLSGVLTILLAYAINTYSDEIIERNISTQLTNLFHGYLSAIDNILWIAGFIVSFFGMSVAVLALKGYQSKYDDKDNK